MSEARDPQSSQMVIGEEANEVRGTPDINGVSSSSSTTTMKVVVRYKWWLQVVMFSFFVLSSQSVATLLGRRYYNDGGKSKWMATLIQTAGFPVLLPFLFLSSTKKPSTITSITTNPPNSKKPSLSVLVSLYLFLGICLAANCMLYSTGLLYLPVSTYSLICASQLAFNAFFSYFLNAQKLTPFIVNSLFLLTISSTLLVFQNDSGGTSVKVSRGKYIIGFLCTVGASAGYGLMLSVTQLAFVRILKSEKDNFHVVFQMIIYPGMVATFVIMVGFFASGDWKTIKGEMDGFRTGRASYLMNLVWTAISWQVFNIGCVRLIFMVSSLFSNVISTLGLPIVPVLAVVFFHEKMNGVKVIAMLLAIWGFCSYIYQHYLDDDLKSKEHMKTVNNHPSFHSLHSEISA